MNEESEPLIHFAISDETACALSALLNHIAYAFDAHYYSQCRRHMETMRNTPQDEQSPWEPPDDEKEPF